jgi:hypothetical protein
MPEESLQNLVNFRDTKVLAFAQGSQISGNAESICGV